MGEIATLIREAKAAGAWVFNGGLVRMRTSLVRMRSRIRAQVHAVLAEHGVATPMSDLLVRREGGCWRNSTCQNSRRVGSKRVCD
jgi:ferric iron reductase protein FhuF